MQMIYCTTGWDKIAQLLVVLVIFIFVLLITAFTTKFIGGYQKTQLSNKNLKIIESLRLANNKYLALIEVGEVYLIVGVGKDEIHTIAKLTKDELPNVATYEDATSGDFGKGFQEILERVKGKEHK